MEQNTAHSSHRTKAMVGARQSVLWTGDFTDYSNDQSYREQTLMVFRN